jgi:hypothetical protein
MAVAIIDIQCHSPDQSSLGHRKRMCKESNPFNLDVVLDELNLVHEDRGRFDYFASANLLSAESGVCRDL